MSGNEKPKVIFLNHWARQLGGAEHSLLDILYYIRDTFDTHLVSTESGPLIDRALDMNITCHIVPCSTSVTHFRRWNLFKSLFLSWTSVISFFIYIIKLRKIVKRIRPVLIHGNVPKAHMALFLLLKTGYRGKSCVHIREIFKNQTTPVSLYTLLFPKKNCTVIAISKSVKDNLPLCMRRKAEIIYNGISIPQLVREDKKNRKVYKLLYLGRIVPWKGCHWLIDILATVRKKYPSKQVELSIIGDIMYWSPDYKGELQKKIITLNLSPYCQLLPYTDNPVSAFLSHDIFCNASFQEPFGRVIAEAQACGMPVVAFNSGAVCEIIDHDKSGILVPCQDVEEFSEAIGRLIQTPDLINKMGLQGRKKVERCFNIKNQGPMLRDFLNSQLSPE
jgi:glycosyltransferase involved in cell wall biosynthesis